MSLMKSKKSPMPEMKSGKSNMALAYAMKRRSAKKELDLRDEDKMEASSKDERDMGMLMGKKLMDKVVSKAGSMKADADSANDDEMMAEGGIVDRIRRKMMAEGGQVDLQDNGDEDLSTFEDRNYKAAHEDTYYDLDQVDAQPEDSNLMGDELEDEDSHDMISRIRKKIRI